MLLLLSLIGHLRAEVHNAIVGTAFRDSLPSNNIPEANSPITIETGKSAKDLSDDMLAKIIFRSKAYKELEKERIAESKKQSEASRLAKSEPHED